MSEPLIPTGLIPSVELPKNIRVGAFDFKVLLWHPMSAASTRRFGEFSAMESTIRVDPSAGRIKTLHTLIHEILHAIYWVYVISDNDDEERTVSGLSGGLTQVLRDNPDLLRFFKESLEGLRQPEGTAAT